MAIENGMRGQVERLVTGGPLTIALEREAMVTHGYESCKANRVAEHAALFARQIETCLKPVRTLRRTAKEQSMVVSNDKHPRMFGHAERGWGVHGKRIHP